MQLKYTLFSSISMLAFSSLSVFSQTEKMNVLFLMADDMRPELGCYGVKEVKTPNIDRFAASGLLFQNAYCNIPVSGASRASLLTGVYPHYPDRFVNYSAYASKDCPTAIPISRWQPQFRYQDGLHHMAITQSQTARFSTIFQIMLIHGVNPLTVNIPTDMMYIGQNTINGNYG